MAKGTRHRTRFGYIIPPWRDDVEKEANKHITIEFIIAGRVWSKKNSQHPTINRSAAIAKIKNYFRTMKSISPKEFFKFCVKLVVELKPYIRNPTEFTDWETKIKEEIVAQAAHWKQSYPQLSYPITHCSINISHYWADEYDRDNSNKAETIHDILVSTGIIADDGYKCLYKNSARAACYKDEMVTSITSIYLTAYKW